MVTRATKVGCELEIAGNCNDTTTSLARVDDDVVVVVVDVVVVVVVVAQFVQMRSDTPTLPVRERAAH
jgi:hypothetical protein